MTSIAVGMFMKEAVESIMKNTMKIVMIVADCDVESRDGQP